MRRIATHVILAALLGSGLCAQQLAVVATQPDLADLCRIIGGDQVEVDSLTDGIEDLHLVRIRPSVLIKVRKADLFVQLGLDAEHAWVPALLLTARNGRIKPGAPGFVSCAAGVEPLRVPGSRSRAEAADLHPSGNPHYNLDPEGMRRAARHIRDGLKRLRPAEAAGFDQRLQAWEAELDAHLERWRARLAPLQNAAFIEYHDTWVYFAERFGLRIVARLEPRPGLSPTPGHLADVVAAARKEGVGLIVSRPVYADVARKVADEVGAKAVTLTWSSTAKGETRGYLAFMDHVVETFASNLRKP